MVKPKFKPGDLVEFNTTRGDYIEDGLGTVISVVTGSDNHHFITYNVLWSNDVARSDGQIDNYDIEFEWSEEALSLIHRSR